MLNKIKTLLIYIALMMSLGFAIFYFFLGPKAQDGGSESTQALFAASFPNENGEKKSLKPYQGKTVVLNFWATWCEPCREEMPALSALNDAYKDKNVVVLGVAVDEVSAIHDFSQEMKVSYPLFAADMQGMDLAASLGNNKGALPYTVIIKADGTVHEIFFGRISQSILEKSLADILS